MVIEIKTDKPYEVIVEDGVLDRAGEKIAPLVRPGSRAMISARRTSSRYTASV